MQYQGIAYGLAQEYLPYTGNAVDLDDLMQAGAIGAIRAAETYNPARGTWFQWCSWYIRQEMQAACGFRTSKRDAAHTAVSLDEPLTEDGFTLADTLTANTPTPEEDWDRQAVSSAVRERVQRLPHYCAAVVESVHLEGMTRAEAAEKLSLSLPQLEAARRTAFDHLRRDPVILDLAELSGIINKTRTKYDLYKSQWAFMQERRNANDEQQKQSGHEQHSYRSAAGLLPRLLRPEPRPHPAEAGGTLGAESPADESR